MATETLPDGTAICYSYDVVGKSYAEGGSSSGQEQTTTYTHNNANMIVQT
ncbi:hypothetical protein ACFW1P_06305 [Paenibacillus sp. NPDC058910]